MISGPSDNAPISSYITASGTFTRLNMTSFKILKVPSKVEPLIGRNIDMFDILSILQSESI
jgi:hypothetical protein